MKSQQQKINFNDEFGNQIQNSKERHIFYRKEIRTGFYCVLYECFYTENSVGVAKYTGHSYDTGTIIEEKFTNWFLYKELDDVYYLDNAVILNKQDVKLLLNSLCKMIEDILDSQSEIKLDTIMENILNYYNKIQDYFLQKELTDIDNFIRVKYIKNNI